jgi:glycosyltransferase involved in cell wall biosynthesis
MLKFSVLIPAFNGERFIDCAIRSALAQSYPPHEILIVDDGSTDRTRQIVESFGAPVRIVSQRNAGVAAARTAGVKLASGDWIALLDQDDYFVETKLQRQAELIERNPNLMVAYSGYRVLTSSGLMADYAAFRASDLWPALRYQSPILPSTAVIRKSALMEIGYFDSQYRMADDWDCWLRLLRRYSAARFGAVPEPLTIYRLWEQNQSKQSLKLLAEAERVAESAIADLNPLSRFLWRKQILSRQYYETSLDLRGQHLGNYLAYIVKSLAFWPFFGPVVPFLRYKVAAHMLLIDAPRLLRERYLARC